MSRSPASRLSEPAASEPAELERDAVLDALADVALGATIPALVFAATARWLDVPLAGPLTLAGLVLGVLPLVGRALWLLLVVLLALLDAGGSSALGTVLVVVGASAASERLARRAIRRWSGGRHAHRWRLVLLVLGFAGAGLAGAVVALGLSPRRRAQRTRRRTRWVAGGLVAPCLLGVAVGPALLFPRQGSEVALPRADSLGQPETPQAVVLYVHGLGEAAGRRGDFDAVLDPLRAQFGRDAVVDAHYYQDLKDRQPRRRACRSDGATLLAPAVPPDLAGMPIDRTTITPRRCDSESDLGLNVLSLTRQIQLLHAATGKRIILVGYSMGGAIVRGVLTLSALRGDRVVAEDVDSVVLLHAVTQGSVLARNGGRIADIPFLGEQISDSVAGTIADPARPAFRELAPRSAYQTWLAVNATRVPAVPTFVTYGDIIVRGESCVLAVYACVTTGTTHLGDVAVDAGTTDPRQQPEDGGARYLPQGRSEQAWEWPETVAIRWDRQLDPLSLQLFSRLYHAKAQHFAILSGTEGMPVTDCRSGERVRESDELRRVLAGRLSGSPYLCRPGGQSGLG